MNAWQKSLSIRKGIFILKNKNKHKHLELYLCILKTVVWTQVNVANFWWILSPSTIMRINHHWMLITIHEGLTVFTGVSMSFWTSTKLICNDCQRLQMMIAYFTIMYTYVYLQTLMQRNVQRKTQFKSPLRKEFHWVMLSQAAFTHTK